MRLIEKTPYLEEDGSISVINRIQGTIKNGFSWYGNLQEQAKAVAFFKKQFDKKFTLIRNLTLDGSEITIPCILIGPPGVYVFIITGIEGTYRAKGDNWGKVDGEKYKEANINLVQRTQQFSKAVNLYLEKQGIELPQPITPILLALNPRLHLEIVRPAIRIVMNDALERFAVQLRQSPPVMVVSDVHQVSEALISPLRKKAAKPTPITPPQEDNLNDLGFSFEDEEEEEEETAQDDLTPAPVIKAASPARKPRRKTGRKTLLGMTTKQLIIIAAMAGFIAIMLIVVTIVALMSL